MLVIDRSKWRWLPHGVIFTALRIYEMFPRITQVGVDNENMMETMTLWARMTNPICFFAGRGPCFVSQKTTLFNPISFKRAFLRKRASDSFWTPRNCKCPSVFPWQIFASARICPQTWCIFQRKISAKHMYVYIYICVYVDCSPPTRVGVTGKYLMQNPNGVDRS